MLPTALIAAAAFGIAPGPRILLIYDMEGVSNVDRESMVECESKADYARGVAGLASDVNAVIAGLLDGGAESVLVADRHGSGCFPDLSRDQLHRATYVDDVRDTTPLWRRPWDAVVLVGMHAASRSGGFLPHTDVWGFTRLVDGRVISEAEELAYSFGEQGIPVIFASGDDVLENALRQSMPWVEFVRVKRTRTVSSALPEDTSTAARHLRTGAAQALRAIGRMRPLRLAGTFRAGLRALPPMTSFRVLQDVPGVSLRDETVEFPAANMDSARAGWRALVRVGNTSLRLDMHEKPEYRNSTRYELWIRAESLAAHP